MDKLQVINHNSIDAVDSREVAQMMEKPHNDLMKSIRNYCDALTAGDFSLSDFFIPSNYVDSTGRRLPCYLITRKGCDFIASRMSGKRGVQFSARYVCAFDDMRKQADAAQMEIMLRMESCKIQKAKLLREMAQQYQGGPFEQTLNACAAQIICGGEVIPLPKSPYQRDLLARLRTDYVHEQQERYRTQLAQLGDAIDHASASERVKLTKQQKKFQDQATELQKYEEKVHHLADQNIEIDLDDGVKHNYELFADVLAKIK